MVSKGNQKGTPIWGVQNLGKTRDVHRGEAAVLQAARIEDDASWQTKLPDFLIQQAKGEARSRRFWGGPPTRPAAISCMVFVLWDSDLQKWWFSVFLLVSEGICTELGGTAWYVTLPSSARIFAASPHMSGPCTAKHSYHVCRSCAYAAVL